MNKCIRMGITAFKFVIWGGKLAVSQSQITFYGDALILRRRHKTKFPILNINKAPRVNLITWLASNEDSHQLAHLCSPIFVPMKKLCILGYLKCAQWRFWSDCTNVQADLNLHWAQMSKGTFSGIAVQIWIYFIFTKADIYKHTECLIVKFYNIPVH